MQSGPSPTKQQVRRFQVIADIGCLACRLHGLPWEGPDIHHLLSGGKRIGHDATIGLCPWHHRGQPKNGLTHSDMAEIFGPNLFDHKRAFHRTYGSDEELLHAQDALIERYQQLAKGEA